MGVLDPHNQCRVLISVVSNVHSVTQLRVGKLLCSYCVVSRSSYCASCEPVPSEVLASGNRPFPFECSGSRYMSRPAISKYMLTLSTNSTDTMFLVRS
jgi:hypothetical protein